jgi:acid phosphatase (class A)
VEPKAPTKVEPKDKDAALDGLRHRPSSDETDADLLGRPTPAFKGEARGFSMPPPPANSSKTTLEEMGSIRRMLKDLSDAQIYRIRHEDRPDVEALFVELLEEYGFTVTKKLRKDLEELSKQLASVGWHYKARFKRMRPQEWLKHKRFKTALPPSKTANSPSYPSNHALIGAFFAKYLGEKFPRAKPTLQEFGKQVGWNRVRAGWHWPSDYAMARELAEHLWKHFDEEGIK